MILHLCFAWKQDGKERRKEKGGVVKDRRMDVMGTGRRINGYYSSRNSPCSLQYSSWPRGLPKRSKHEKKNPIIKKH